MLNYSVSTLHIAIFLYFYIEKLFRKMEDMKTKEEYIADIRQFKEQFASKYGIRSIGIFGSVARGEHGSESDLDVFVDIEEADPFILFDIHETLEAICGCKVDLLRLRKDLRSLLLKRIEQDVIYA